MSPQQDLPPIEFVLTPQDRDTAALAALHLEAHRRRQNERDAMMALARWKGGQYRPRSGA
jgi:hypothetical protein